MESATEISGSLLREARRELVQDLLGGAVVAADFLPPAFDTAIKGYVYHPREGYRVCYDFERAMDLAAVLWTNPEREVPKMCLGRKVVLETDLDKADPLDKEAAEKMASEMEKEAAGILGGPEECENGKDYLGEVSK